MKQEIELELQGEFQKNSISRDYNWNWASDIGESCLRFLYFRRLLPKMDFNYRLALGKSSFETYAATLISKVCEISASQLELVDERLRLKGKVDFVVRQNGVDIPLEVKTLLPPMYNSLKNIEDFSKGIPFSKKFVCQCMSYLMMMNVTHGFLFLINQVDFDFNIITVQRDDALIQKIQEKCAILNTFVEKRELPPFDVVTPDKCLSCSYFDVCGPNLDVKEYCDDEVSELLKRMEEIQNYHKEYEEISKRLRDRFSVFVSEENPKACFAVAPNKFVSVTRYYREGFQTKPTFVTSVRFIDVKNKQDES